MLDDVQIRVSFIDVLCFGHWIILQKHQRNEKKIEKYIEKKQVKSR